MTANYRLNKKNIYATERSLILKKDKKRQGYAKNEQ